MAEENSAPNLEFLETLMKIQFTNINQFVEDINRNFATIQNSPLFKGIPGKKGDEGDDGLRGIRGSQFIFVDYDKFNEQFPNELTAGSKITLEYINSKLTSFENKQKLLNALGVSELVDNDVVVLTNSVMLSYDLLNEYFVETGLAFNEQSNLISNIQEKIEQYVKYYVDNNPTILGIQNIFETYTTYARSSSSTNSPTVTRQLTKSSIYSPYIDGYNSTVGIKLNDHKYFSYSDKEFPIANNGTLVLGSIKKYYELLENTINTSTAQSVSSYYTPTQDNIPTTIFIQDTLNNGLMFGPKSWNNLKNFGSIYKTIIQSDITGVNNAYKALVIKSDQGNVESEYSQLILSNIALEYAKLVRFGSHLSVAQDLHLKGFFDNNHIRTGEYTVSKNVNDTEIGFISSDTKRKGTTKSTTRFVSPELEYNHFLDNVLITDENGMLLKDYSLERTSMITSEEQSLVLISKIPNSDKKLVTSNYLGYLIRKINGMTQYCIDNYWRKNQFNTGEIPNLTLSENLTVKGNVKFGQIGSELFTTDNATGNVGIGINKGLLTINNLDTKFLNFKGLVLVTDSSGNLLKTKTIETLSMKAEEQTARTLIKTVPTNINNFVTSNYLDWFATKINNIITDIYGLDLSDGGLFWRKDQYNTGDIPEIYIKGLIKNDGNITNSIFNVNVTGRSITLGDSNLIDNITLQTKALTLPDFKNIVLVTNNTGNIIKTKVLETLAMNDDELLSRVQINTYPSETNNIITGNYYSWLVRKINNIIHDIYGETTGGGGEEQDGAFWRKNQYNTAEIPYLWLSHDLKVNNDVRFGSADNPIFSTNNDTNVVEIGKTGTGSTKVRNTDFYLNEYKNKVLVTNNEGKVVKDYELEQAVVNDNETLVPTSTIDTEKLIDLVDYPNSKQKIVTSNYLKHIYQTFNNIKKRFKDTFNKKETINEIYKHVPVGTIVMWSYAKMGVYPDGWAPCDGNQYTTIDETGKESRISTPDLRDKFIRCAESFDLSAEKTGGGGNSGVKNQVKLMVSNLPSHTHSINFKTTTSINFGNTNKSITTDSGGSHSHAFNSQRIARNRNTRKGIIGTEQYNPPDGEDRSISKNGSSHTHTFNSRNFGNITGVELTINGATEKIGDGQSFSIEPEYYALMFIMKIRNN